MTTAQDTPQQRLEHVEPPKKSWLREALDRATQDGRDANLERYLRFLGWRDDDWLELQVVGASNRTAPVRGQGFAHANTAADIRRLTVTAQRS